MLTINVVGTPAPQGSKKGFYNQRIGRVQMVESSKKVAPWRQDVRAAAIEAMGEHWDPIEGPVLLAVLFYLPRPQGHYGTGRNARVLKASAPSFPAVKPDVDKLLRSTLDALGEAGCWRDDSRVVDVHAVKLYADGVLPGARITVSTPEVSVSAPQEEGGADTGSIQESLLP